VPFYRLKRGTILRPLASPAERITIREADIVLPPVPPDRTAVQSTAKEVPDPAVQNHPGANRVVARVMHAANRLSFAKDVASLTRTCGRISAIQRCTREEQLKWRSQSEF
jgi:hypothetical protein